MFHEISGIEKFYGKEGGGGGEREYQDFASVFSCLIAKKIRGEPFTVSLISGIEKCYACEGYVTYFFRNFLSRTIEKLRRGTLLCFTKFLVSKRFMEKRGGEEGGSITIFRQFFLVSLPKKSLGKPFFVLLISGIEKCYACEGCITTFCREFFVSEYRKTS